jgi:hypothetical protein
MIQAVERYLSKVDLAHPVWYHLRLAPLLWHYLYGPLVPFPPSPSPVSTTDGPHPLVPPLPPLLRCRSLTTLLDGMRADGSLPPSEALPTDESIVRYCHNRRITTSIQLSSDTSPDTTDGICSSRRAALLATDIAGVPYLPGDEDGAAPEPCSTSPDLPVIDLSAYALVDCLPPPPDADRLFESITSLPFPQLDSSSSVTTPTSMPASEPNSSIPTCRSTQPACKYFSIFDNIRC